jgi:exopolyphosphatase/guanosine-5'-triphosphate,3'-diphosphate pyrophosphatase
MFPLDFLIGIGSESSMISRYCAGGRQMKERPKETRDGRIRAAREFAQTHDPDPQHAFQVCKNSLALFDALMDLHGLGQDERFLLEAAALMHDTGYENQPMQHHKGSRDMVMAANLEGYSARELTMVACIARYHRKGSPKPSHKGYKDLDKDDRQRVRKLAGILRVADGLDRCHASSAAVLRAEITPPIVRIYIRQRINSPTDIEFGLRKADLFETAFGLKLEIIPERP